MRGRQTVLLGPELQQQQNNDSAGYFLTMNRALAWDFLAMNSDAAPATPRNHALALAFRTNYLGVALSLELSS
eukprot:509227-Pyramimonas_sp.AAC.1